MHALYSYMAGKIRKTADGRYEAYMVPPAAANHASFLELLPHGGLGMAWFSGTQEGANNCSIVVAYLSSGSSQWSNASLVSRRSGYSNQNPVLFLDPTGQVLHVTNLPHHYSHLDFITSHHPLLIATNSLSLSPVSITDLALSPQPLFIPLTAGALPLPLPAASL